MARNHGRLFASLWAPGSDFLDLDVNEQRLFAFIISQPDLSQAGLLPLRERRWARSAKGLTVEDVTRAWKGLEAARYVLVDEDTEELLVRSFVRRDGVYKQPKVMVAMADQARQMQSIRLRDAFAVELRRLPLHELASPNQRAEALRVVNMLLAEFDSAGQPVVLPDSDTHSPDEVKGYPEGFAIPETVDGDTHPDTPLRAGARVHSHKPQTTEQTPLFKPDGSNGGGEASKPKSARTSKLDQAWEAWWTTYPRKQNKGAGRKAWDNARTVKGKSVEFLLAAVQEFAADPNLPLDKTKLPHASTWLNNERWDDDPYPAPGDAPGRTAAGDVDVDAVLGKDRWQPPAPPENIQPGSRAFIDWTKAQWQQRHQQRRAEAEASLARRRAS